MLKKVWELGNILHTHFLVFSPKSIKVIPPHLRGIRDVSLVPKLYNCHEAHGDNFHNCRIAPNLHIPQFNILKFAHFVPFICWIREAFKKKCISYDIWQKGRESKDQKQISEQNLNLDKVLGGVGKWLQCHKNSYLKNLVFYCLEKALFGQKISNLKCFQSI